MSTFHRVFRSFFHWRRLRLALGEILMITVGIHLAFGLDRIGNYYERLDLEHKTLIELRNGVERDRLDIEQNIQGYEIRMGASALIDSYLDSGRPPDQAFSKALRELQSTTMFLPSNVPFETLKARGLDIVDDEKLRGEIAEYYEIHRALLLSVENGHNAEKSRFVLTFIKRYLDIRDDPTVVSYNLMRKDDDFRRELHWLTHSSREMIKHYAAMEGRAKLLVNRLNSSVK